VKRNETNNEVNRMKRLLSFLLIAIFAIPAMGQAVTFGMTEFPLGEDAFPNASECLDPTGCGSSDNILVDATNPLLPQVSAASALIGHRLDLVTIDLDELDEIRLQFPVPIVNQPGPDAYVAQALFIGTLDGLGDAQGINDVGIRFGGSPTWHDLPLADFAGDLGLLGPVYVTYADPELKQDAYAVQERPAPQPPLAGLWFIKPDLSDFGFAPDTEIQEVVIRGSSNLAGSGLDVAIVGNLNSSGSPGPVRVPDVVGQNRTTAEAAIAGAGLAVVR